MEISASSDIRVSLIEKKDDFVSLLNEIRKEKHAEPTRSRFKRKIWEEWANSSSSSDDRSLAKTALWIADQLSNIRKLVVMVDADYPASKYERCRAIVSACNRETILAGLRASKIMGQGRPPGSLIPVNKLVELKVDLDSGKFSPDEIIQSVVDSCQIPLSLIEGDSSSKTTGKVDEKDLITAINVGIAYAFVEDLWDKVVWRNYRVSNDNSGLSTFYPVDVDIVDWQAESMYRGDYLKLQEVGSAINFARSNNSIRIEKKKVVGLRREGKRRVVDVGRVDFESVNDRIDMTTFYVQLPVYYRDVRNTEWLRQKEVTLDVIVESWRILGGLGRILKTEMNRLEERFVNDDLTPGNGVVDINQYLRPLSVSMLVSIIQRSLDVSPVVARGVIDFLTFDPERNSELWTQPLVKVSDDSVAAIIACLVDANVSRNVDKWLQQLGQDLMVRGPMFERYIYESFLDDDVSQIISSEFKCLEGGVKFTPQDGRSEQIDVVIRAGDMVVIGEAKCTLRPTDDKMWARHRDVVDGAVLQVKRKVECVNSNKLEFEALLREKGVKFDGEFSVVPIVIMSCPVHVGKIIDGVLIADMPMLSVFFRNKLEQGVVDLADGGREVASIETFFDSSKNMKAAIENYFSDPPQLRPIRAGLKWRDVEFSLPSDACAEVKLRSRMVEVDVEAALLNVGIPQVLKQRAEVGVL